MIKNNFLETIKAVDGEVLHLSYHQKRYESVLEHFGVRTFKDLASLLEPPQKGVYKCRVVYDAENTFTITYAPYTKKQVKTLQLVYDDTVTYRFKTTSRDKLEALYAQRDVCDDVLIIKNGYVTDTSIANIAFYDGQDWLTPSTPLLKGVTRQRLLDEGKLKVADIKAETIKNFFKVALCNAMIDFDIITDISFKD